MGPALAAASLFGPDAHAIANNRPLPWIGANPRLVQSDLSRLRGARAGFGFLSPIADLFDPTRRLTFCQS